MPATNANPIEYWQRIFEETYENTRKAQNDAHAEMLRRRTVSYGLKAISVFGGIAVTAGVSGGIAHVIGIAIAVAVAIDAFFLNHTRLITVSKADKAYKYLLKDVKNTHQVQLGPILELMNAGDPQGEQKLKSLTQSLKTRLDSEGGSIEKALDEVDIKALTALSLEENKRHP